MQVRVKKLHPDATIPAYSKQGDAGLDLTAISATKDNYGNVVYGTGLAIEIPQGYVGLIYPRSSNSKTDLYLTNHVGVIDSGYRGEITAKMHITTDAAPAIYKVGEKFMQLIVMPFVDIDIVESADLSESDRGEGGYGSSDKDTSAGDGNSADPTT